jgi:anti-sigma factor RsiW
MMRPRRPEPHTLAGAYAMDAVTAADKARFERHLASCPACARELAELGEASARLAAAVATEPPGDLVQRVVASAARTPQLPPAAPGQQPAGASRAPASRAPRSPATCPRPSRRAYEPGWP